MSKNDETKGKGASQQEAQGDSPKGSFQRRSFLTGSVGGALLALMGRVPQAEAASASASVNCEPGTLVLQPPEVAASFFQTKLSDDPTFQKFYEHFTKQGFEFIPSRVKLAFGFNTDRLAEDGPSRPYLLAIIPSFRPFPPEAPSHEAVSIVLLRDRNVSNVFATTVVVGHAPYQLLELGVVEEDAAGGFFTSSITRKSLTGLDAQRLAAMVGDPKMELQRGEGIPTKVAFPNFADSMGLGATIYEQLLTDEYAGPLYPPEGRESMLADTVLVNRWAETQFVRYSNKGSAARMTACTSSSTSSNACTSTSTSSTFTIFSSAKE